MDAEVATDERDSSGRRSRVVLTASGLASNPREAKLPADDGDKQILIAGESTYKPSNHCAGKAGMLPLNLYARVRSTQ